VSARLGAVGSGLPGLTAPFAAAVLAAPLALALGRALPAEGGGLALRLAAAGALVLLLPGALILRALGWPARLGLALAGSLVWSLAACFLFLALTFAANASLSLAVALLGVVAAGALVAAARARAVPGERLRAAELAVLLAGGIALCAAVWWASRSLSGDELYHLARVRKLDELPTLFSVKAVVELQAGGPDPASAFPLWHGALALVSRLAGVDPALVVQHLGGVLVPLALLLAYAAGRELFGPGPGGLLTAVGQAAAVALPRGGTGAYAALAAPAVASLLLAVPALLALVFAYLADGRRLWLVWIGVGALGVGALRPSHAVFVAIALAGFLLARGLAGTDARADVRRLAVALAAVALPFLLLFAWLWQFAHGADAFLPPGAYRDAALAAHAAELQRAGSLFALDAGAAARGGAGAVAGLVAVAVCALGWRRRAEGFVVGATLVLLAVALTPPLFRVLSDLVTLTEAERLVLVLPLPFALAGAALLAARARSLGVLAAAGLATGLALAYGQGSTAAGWAAWAAAAACLAALAVRPRAVAAGAGPWALAAAAALALPLAVTGLAGIERDRPDRSPLPAGLVEAVRAGVSPRAVVFADLETSYRLAAAAPVLVAAAPPAHVAATEDNAPAHRRRDVIDFFWNDRLSYLGHAELLARYGASWLLVDGAREAPAYVRFLGRPVYDDGRYALYDLRRNGA
jgi:hypothetical protein